MAKNVYWIGDPGENCQVCQRPFMSTMFDCRLPQEGVWANICNSCFLQRGCRLGVGLGQKYRRQEDGQWLKIDG